MPAKVDEIFENISKLSMMEVFDLVKKIETEYGVSAMAPVAAAPTTGGDAEVKPEIEKTEFKVNLKDVGQEKIKVIKALRSVTTLALKEARDMVDSAPCVVKDSASKEEAQKIKEALEAAGAKVELA